MNQRYQLLLYHPPYGMDLVDDLLYLPAYRIPTSELPDILSSAGERHPSQLIQYPVDLMN